MLGSSSSGKRRRVSDWRGDACSESCVLHERALGYSVMRFLALADILALCCVALRVAQEGRMDPFWSQLLLERRWGGVAPESLILNRLLHKLHSAGLSARILYRTMHMADSSSRCAKPHEVELLQHPGVLGRLGRFVETYRDEDLPAARCCFLQDPLLVLDFEVAKCCHHRTRELGLRPFPILVLSLITDAVSGDTELPRKLALLREQGGTCRPLLDCLRSVPQARLSENALLATLQSFVGAAAICDGDAEAEVICKLNCGPVYTSCGTRYAEFQGPLMPEIMWTSVAHTTADALPCA